MQRVILHIDYNSYFATVEQQANPRLRGKPIGVTGGDRMERTVVGAASVEAKKLGVKTGMSVQEARQICPDLILVRGDSDKYLACTKRFLNILKDYSPTLEIFSIDEAFVELCFDKLMKSESVTLSATKGICKALLRREKKEFISFANAQDDNSKWMQAVQVAIEIKDRIRKEIGEWITVSVGISYNKTLAKLAGSLYKPDGLHVIADEEAAIRIIDQISFDDICGIGPATKKHLFNMGICDFPTLRKVPLSILLSSFKSYGNFLYNIARGENHDPLITFYEKPEVKSVGHQNTLMKDTNDEGELQQTLLKMCELIGKRLRDKKLVGRTVVCFFRYGIGHAEGRDPSSATYLRQGFVDPQFHSIKKEGYPRFESSGMQTTLFPTDDGLEIFKAAWRCFTQLWDREYIRLIGVSVSNVSKKSEVSLSLLPEVNRTEIITRALDRINDRYGEFTLQRGVLLGSHKMRRKPNPFLSDRRFKI